MADGRVAGTPLVGLVGLGLMGRGIAACLLGHGYEVVAYNRTHARARRAREAIGGILDEAVRRRTLKRSHVKGWQDRCRPRRSCEGLADCPIVIETIKEDLPLKRRLFGEIEKHVAPDTVIASNTSSFPIVLLQKGRKHPERMIVMHWAEPAWITRFMEIVRNEVTTDETVRRAEAVGERCGKEPGVLQFDIRGFVANRLMYAFIREACYLADIGVADFETIDRSFRNDTGWWSALAGPFRWMDLTGIESYGLVMKDLLPELCNDGRMPGVMRKMLREGAKGVANRKGFYPYTRESAKAWEEAWVDFTYDMRSLVKRYEERVRRPRKQGKSRPTRQLRITGRHGID